MARALSFFFLLAACASVSARGNKHRYNQEDPVPFLVNTIGPYSNPSETYAYYSLPFCKPEYVQHARQDLGNSLEGDMKQSSLYDIRFKVPIHFQSLCEMHLTAKEIKQFKHAIEQYYYFECFYDALPVWGFVGTMLKQEERQPAETQYFLFKHLHFMILYNADQIVKISATADPSKVQPLNDKDEDLLVEFSYSAEWHETNFTFNRRMELYKESFFSKELEIHWLSIMNSVVLVILLSGFLSIILMRVLKSDYARYSRVEEDEDEEDYGWKLIHGDVFRFPPYKSFFSAAVGVGAQFLIMTFGILILALVGVFYPANGGALYTAAIVLYALTAVVAGFVSGGFYHKLEGSNWSWNLVLCAGIYAGPFFVVASFVNTVAWIWHAATALPATTFVIVICIWGFVGVPLTVIGGIAGKHSAGPFEAPCRTKNFPREIPSIHWYRRAPFQMIMAGFLPFSAIYIELFYVFSSVWGHSSYQLYGILFLVYLILLIVTSCITVALTYFQLSMEDHRWWWSAFLSGGSTGIFIYAYSVFYYLYRSKMSGFLQASFYFGYMAVICYFFFLMLGTVGFYSSLLFVRRIYVNLKCE